MPDPSGFASRSSRCPGGSQSKLRVRVAECLSTVTEILAARAALLRLALLPAPFA
jgi:hypothetical protein